MIKPKLILIRHGVTEDNNIGRLMGRNDSPLMREAVDKARSLGASGAFIDAAKNVSHIWSSPLPRAYETALLLAGYPEKVRKADELLERDFGVYNGKILDELWKSDPKWPAAEGEYATRPENGESLADVEQRVFPFIVNLHDTTPQDENIILVGHSTVWRLVVAALNSRRQYPLVEKIAGPLSIQDFDRSAIEQLRKVLPGLEGQGS